MELGKFGMVYREPLKSFPDENIAVKRSYRVDWTC